MCYKSSRRRGPKRSETYRICHVAWARIPKRPDCKQIHAFLLCLRVSRCLSAQYGLPRLECLICRSFNVTCRHDNPIAIGPTELKGPVLLSTPPTLILPDILTGADWFCYHDCFMCSFNYDPIELLTSWWFSSVTIGIRGKACRVRSQLGGGVPIVDTKFLLGAKFFTVTADSAPPCSVQAYS